MAATARRDAGGRSTSLPAGLDASLESRWCQPSAMLLAICVYDSADVLALKRGHDPVRVVAVNNLK
jgi:hypothetical protein